MPRVRKGLPREAAKDRVQVNLHPLQMEILNSPARFKVVVAGRRAGKTYTACALILAKCAEKPDKSIFYVAPSFDQGKRAAWHLLKQLAGPMLDKVYESEGYLIINGVHVYFRGADRPDLMRGVGLSFAVLDEYASMRPAVWSSIIRQALMDSQGGALFIGSPAGKNHFYDLYIAAESRPDWARWRFSSYDNPFLKKEELDDAAAHTSTSEAKREIFADFNELGGEQFKEDWIQYDAAEPANGAWVVALDPAGFVTAGASAARATTDNAAIAVVKIAEDGAIWVRDIYAGRWGVTETANKFLDAVTSVPFARCGIEKGALANALAEELQTQARRRSVFISPEPLSNGGRNKQQRIAWALEAAFELGRIKLRPAPWNRDFVLELMDFPEPRARDDRIDALSFAVQMMRGHGETRVENLSWDED